MTYLVPIFGMLWGALFLGETINAAMIIASGVIFFGTALPTASVTLPKVQQAAEAAREACEVPQAPKREPVRIADFR